MIFTRFSPTRSPLAHRMFLIKENGVEVALDVGENFGQYACEIRENGYWEKMISFEPQSKEHADLTAKMGNDTVWKGENIGLGSKDSEKTINISNTLKSLWSKL